MATMAARNRFNPLDCCHDCVHLQSLPHPYVRLRQYGSASTFLYAAVQHGDQTQHLRLRQYAYV